MAAPAIMVGGVALVMPYSNLRQLISLLVLPGAVAGMIGGLVDRGLPPNPIGVCRTASVWPPGPWGEKRATVR